VDWKTAQKTAPYSLAAISINLLSTELQPGRRKPHLLKISIFTSSTDPDKNLMKLGRPKVKKSRHESRTEECRDI
jgi:hypothetical protein